MKKKNNVSILRELTRVLVRNMGFLDKSEAVCCGTTLAQCNVIVEIGRAHEITLNEVADLLKLDNSTISRTINNLADQQLVERETDLEDRRYIKLRLTDKGRHIFETTEKNMNAYYEAILRDIPEEKHEQVIESLMLLVEAVKNNKCC
ncbi:MAG: MarR family winged helix-turn-helix transcriptional regulator [Bacillota bacterium]